MRVTSFRGLRAAVAAVLIAASILVGGAAAQASATGYVETQFEDDMATVPAHAALPRTVEASVYADGPLTHAGVTFDFSGLAGVASATVDPAAQCVVSGASAACPIVDVADGDQQHVTFKITLVSDPAATDGATGSITATGFEDGVPIGQAKTMSITVSDRAQLAMASVGFEEPAAIGDVVSQPVAVANVGSKPVAGVEMVFQVSHSIEPNTYDNCLYANWAAIDGTFVSCIFPGALATGQQMKLGSPFQGTITPDSARVARVDVTIFETSATTPSPPPASDSDFAGATAAVLIAAWEAAASLALSASSGSADRAASTRSSCGHVARRAARRAPNMPVAPTSTTRRRGAPSSTRSVRQLHQHLAEVGAGHQVDHRRGGVADAVVDGLVVLDAALLQPRRHVRVELRRAGA